MTERKHIVHQGTMFPTWSSDVVTDSVAGNAIQLVSLNLRTPPPPRALPITEYLLTSKCNVMFLTELRASPGSEEVIENLMQAGFSIFYEDVPPPEYCTVVATKGFQTSEITFDKFDLSHRVTTVEIETSLGRIMLVAVYAPSNGMTFESSARREAFQQSFRNSLRSIRRHHPKSGLILGGDLNVLEPNHHPRLHTFEKHDYDFYSDLHESQLVDAFRMFHPDRIEHSWIDRFGGGQRLDHLFVSEQLKAKLTECRYDHSPRKSKLSDHSAMLLTLQY